jgi:DNA replication protein DnaC
VINELPPRYTDAIIEREITPEWNQDIHSVCINYLEDWLDFTKDGIAPFLAGTPGTGKTYAAAAVINRLVHSMERLNETVPTFVWAPVGRVLDVLSAHREFRSDTYWKLDSALKGYDIVVFDDISYLRDYPRLKDLFWVYVNHRYEHKKPTMFTCNINMENGWDPLIQIFGDALCRRLKEMSAGLAVYV